MDISIEGDGLQTRDFIHVNDVSETIISACSFAPESEFEILNLGSGKSVSIIDYADLVIRLANEVGFQTKSEKSFTKSREGDVKHSLADLSGLNKYVDFENFTEFELGVRELLLFWKQRIHTG
jgi:UDP-glucose 4-epimerase